MSNTHATPSSLLLNDYRCIRVSGSDAGAFLQGQLTQDVDKITPELSLLGACCNNKGRVIANFRLVAWENDLVLRIHTLMAEPLLSHLNKYARFSKVKLCIDDTLRVYGLMAHPEYFNDVTLPETENACALIHKAQAKAMIIKTDAAHHCFEVISAHALPWLEALSAPHHMAQWRHHQFKRKTLDITPELSAHYTPQQIGLDTLGAVDFKKGCYTGQEIVARLHFLGKLKNHLQYLMVEGTGDVRPGDSITLKDSTTVVGTVLAINPLSETRRECLANLQDSVGPVEILNLSTHGAYVETTPRPE